MCDCEGILCRRSEHPNEALSEHSCPFKVEINDDYDSLCACCDDCIGECAMEV